MDTYLRLVFAFYIVFSQLGYFYQSAEEFVSADEQQKAVIGGGYLSNILQTGILGKGFGVLTERPSETETLPKLM